MRYETISWRKSDVREGRKEPSESSPRTSSGQSVGNEIPVPNINVVNLPTRKPLFSALDYQGSVPRERRGGRALEDQLSVAILVPMALLTFAKLSLPR